MSFCEAVTASNEKLLDNLACGINEVVEGLIETGPQMLDTDGSDLIPRIRIGLREIGSRIDASSLTKTVSVQEAELFSDGKKNAVPILAEYDLQISLAQGCLEAFDSHCDICENIEGKLEENLKKVIDAYGALDLKFQKLKGLGSRSWSKTLADTMYKFKVKFSIKGKAEKMIGLVDKDFKATPGIRNK